MKKVIIRCFSNYNLVNKCHIVVLDKDNNKLYDEDVIYKKAELYLRNGAYKVIIRSLNVYSVILLTSFIVTNHNNCFNLYLTPTNNSLKITITLVDKNCNNLPIERGKIKLWQDHIR